MKEKINLSILYSKYLPNTLDAMNLQNHLMQSLTEEITIHLICAEQLGEDSLSQTTVLINLLGSYFPENSWRWLLNYFNHKGRILNFGPNPFSIPYKVQEEQVKLFEKTERAWHSLGIVDTFVPTGPIQNHKFKLIQPQYGFLQELFDAGDFPEMMETYSGYYQLAEALPNGKHFLDGQVISTAQLEVAFGFEDIEGHLIAAPLTKIDHFEKGSMMFLNFDSSANYWNSHKGLVFAQKITEQFMKDSYHMEIKPSMARYLATEDPRIAFSIQRIFGQMDISKELALVVELMDVSEEVVLKTYHLPLDGQAQQMQGDLEVLGLEEGFYRVRGRLMVEGVVEKEISSGFYKWSDQTIQNKLKHFPKLSIDPTVTSDYCVAAGVPFLMHGVNYHTTDNYRRCFIDFNPYQCYLDLSTLTHSGMNILRTGNWLAYDQFYSESGEINGHTLRNLEAFFLTALHFGLTTQFVLGAFIMNHWDRNQCPVHHPEMRQKTIKAFASFANHFKHWPNIQIDAINEPSYSIHGMWHLAKPSEDPYERVHWLEWLKVRYNNQIDLLRENWGVSDALVPYFEQAELPTEHQRYERSYDRRDSNPSGALRDFYDFAFESYSGWVADLRQAVKSENHEMLFMMGRDENLRVPAQQYEAYQGTIDMVNLHHWHKDAFSFAEYLFNRVKNIPCCSQEIGVYQFGDQRNNTRFSEVACAEVLERKLLYACGNWIQWQAYNDPYMTEIVERSLGLIRADYTENPNMVVARRLATLEEKMRAYHVKRDESGTQIMVVFPTSGYFSVDSSLVMQGMLRSVQVLYEKMKYQGDIVLEKLLLEDNGKQWGNPKLIIVPSLLCLSQKAWEVLLDLAAQGSTVLFSGMVNRDEYWKQVNRLEALGIPSQTQSVDSVEQLRIGQNTYEVSFRENMGYFLPKTVLDKNIYTHQTEQTVLQHAHGLGQLLFCPMAMELGYSFEAISGLYGYAIEAAGIQPNIFKCIKPCQESILIYPMVYESCTVYTIVNEGYIGEVHLLDLRSNTEIIGQIQGQRGMKIWIGLEGELLGAYLNGSLTIHGETYRRDYF